MEYLREKREFRGLLEQPRLAISDGLREKAKILNLIFVERQMINIKS